MSFGVKTNRLAKESSPYLLQHAYNPVDWYPWGDEAFEAATKLDRPIFLSIGYSSCHWCHVMERECFEDDEVAELMNKGFISVKVDREERPDIDGVYMKACQMMTGGGGWPLTIIMTPDKRPFYAATFVPKTSRYGIPGMMDILPIVTNTWTERRGDLYQVAQRVVSALTIQDRSEGRIDAGEIEGSAFHDLIESYEEKYGGFEVAPKFPSPHKAMFLLRHWRRSRHPKALEMARHTLGSMSLGGIYDHIGGGFHRYSTDRRWFLPHFEKMLYDQAMISMACTECYLATGSGQFMRTAIGTLDYVLRDLSQPDGGFYSSEDADSSDGEGIYYTWTIDEIAGAVRKDDLALIIELFDVRKDGNYRVDESCGYNGRNILHMIEEVPEYSNRKGLREDAVSESVTDALKALFKARAKRERPRLDDKVLLDWNGLMIAALSKGGRSLGQPRYIERAERVVHFIETMMRAENNSLLHRFRDGEAGIEGFLTDHAFYTWGLIELYQATMDQRYLKLAAENATEMDRLFESSSGGFYVSRGDDLIAREMESYDGAMPSGNSVALYANVVLAELTGDKRFEEAARRTVDRFSGDVGAAPSAHCFFAIGTSMLLNGASVVKMRRDSRGIADEEVRDLIDRSFAPEVLMTVSDELAGGDVRSIAQVCRGNACLPAVTDIGSLKEQLGI
ncbi:MAG: thioredoxin domain-containing protein [Euryarchaeota archaeon]|nr:thioredoxin domain-containing protein [Euryarchaeota archaeon]